MTRIEWGMNEPGNDIGDVHIIVPADQVETHKAALRELGFAPTVVES